MPTTTVCLADYPCNVFDNGMTLGQRIEHARRLKGLSQSDLTSAIGLPKSHQSRVSRWERDGGIPTLAQLVAISDATGMPLDFLMRGVEPEPIPTLTYEEQSILQLYHALDITVDQALRALALAAAEGRPPASGPARQLGVRVTTEHHQRLERDRAEAAAKAAAKAAEAAREKQAANTVGGKSSA